MKHEEVTEETIRAFYKVFNTLGYGFIEKVYQKAMVIELRNRGLEVEPEAPIEVCYEGQVVGVFFADLFVARCVVVELKAVEHLVNDHHAQLLNYMKASQIEVGLLLNFGPKPELKRKVFDVEPPF